TKPGVTRSPVASISRRPAPALGPTEVILPPSIATSPMKLGWPVPSTIFPLRITRSCMLSVPPERSFNKARHQAMWQAPKTYEHRITALTLRPEKPPHKSHHSVGLRG